MNPKANLATRRELALDEARQALIATVWEMLRASGGDIDATRDQFENAVIAWMPEDCGQPTYRVTHDRIAPEPCEVTERELRDMLAGLHADDPGAGWNVALEVTDDAIYALGAGWDCGREEIAERMPDQQED